MDNDFNTLCRLRTEMMDMLSSMRSRTIGTIDRETVARQRVVCDNLISAQGRLIAHLAPDVGLHGIGGNPLDTGVATQIELTEH